MTAKIEQFTSDAISVVLDAEDGDGQAEALLMLLADYLWETFRLEVGQQMVLITLLFPGDEDEHAA